MGESIDPWGLPLDEQPTADTAPDLSEDSQALNLLKRKFEEFKPKFSKAVYRHAFKAIGLTDANDYAEIISVPIVLKKLSNLVGGQFNGKQIVINSKAATEDQIETLLHEMIHVAVYQWYGNEDHSHGAFFEAIHEKVIGPMPDSWKQELGESVDHWGMPS